MPITRRRKQALKPVDTNRDGHKLKVTVPTSSAPKRRKPTDVKAASDSKPASASRRSSKRLSLKLEQVQLDEQQDAKENVGGEEDWENIKDEPDSGVVAREENEGDRSLEDIQGTSSGVSDYEQRRLKNMEENAKFFASLGIFQAKDDLVASAKPQKTKKTTLGLKSERRRSAPIPKRAPSLRLQGKTPEGSEIPGFDGFRPTFFESPISEEREKERHPAGPVAMDCMNVKKETREGEDFIQSLKEMKIAAKELGAEGASLLERLKTLTLAETRVAKVVPDRSFSIGFHPSETKTILAVGDKWGKLGFWNLNSSEGEDGVFLFSPHVRPVNCLKFDPSQASRIFTCSYDGTVRCGDFEKGVFDEIYATEEEHYSSMVHCFDFLDETGTHLIVTHNEVSGHVTMVDTRSQKNVRKLYKLHDKSIRTVSVHPVKRNYFVTASTDSLVAVYDIRKLQSSHDAICRLNHGRGLNSAYFSPVTGNKILTTCADDKLRVYRLDETDTIVKGASLATSKYHNNHTGRWLTKFRAIWHPRCEELIMSGSMARPRRIELFSDKLELVHEYLSEEWLGSVCSLNAFHPTRDIVAGTNSSGRVHVFM